MSVTAGDVVANAVAAEFDSHAVAGAAVGDPVAPGIDGYYAPAVVVSTRILRRFVAGGVEDPDRGLVAVADDQVTDRVRLLTLIRGWVH